VLGSPTTFDTAYQFVGGGSTVPPVLPTREGPILGRPKYEWSDMTDADASPSSADKILIAGDIAAGFRIVDRLGMTVELVPHLFGANQRPTGQRGLFAYWRTSSKTIVPQAIRVLKVL
jgi:HK97 family phage major capsid protein